MANSKNLQKTIDGLINRVFLRFIPKSVRPNHITVIRFLLTPIIFIFLQSQKFDIALAIFIIAASTDFIDGAMARTRNQITDIGKIIDPIADKLLILSVISSIGFDYLIVKIFIVVIFIELLSIFISASFSIKFGRPIGANIFGKMKMILQSFGVGLFIIGILAKNDLVIHISEGILFVALIFAILSGLMHLWLRIKRT